MTPSRLRVFAVLGVLAAAACCRADDAPPAVQDDAHLFDEPAARQASEQLHDVGKVYGLDFLLRTVEKPPEEVQKQLKEAKDTVQKDKVLRAWGAEEARKAGGDAVYILVCKDVIQGWVWTYGCVVVTVPPEARTAQFTDADARRLHDRLRWFTRGSNKAKNDAILLSSVAQVRDDLAYNHLPPFPWLEVGGLLAGRWACGACWDWCGCGCGPSRRRSRGRRACSRPSSAACSAAPPATGFTTPFSSPRPDRRPLSSRPRRKRRPRPKAHGGGGRRAAAADEGRTAGPGSARPAERGRADRAGAGAVLTSAREAIP